MYRQLADGDVQGVLNDFDMAKPTVEDASNSSTSRHRTGTKPFMAVDLLVEEPPQHLFRHDLESFMYVLMFLVCDTETSKLDKWRFWEMGTLKSAKESMLRHNLPETKEGFDLFITPIYNLHHMFGQALQIRDQAALAVAQNQRLQNMKSKRRIPEIPMDDATLGGRVTFDTFAAALTETDDEA
ncbi:hypothetical protein FB45DRAFT_885919 [Roridomyces roridus]|uniref:Fungal-type protein kinase domain-containing protein n=1 Tax=Roridomyces roridus TaxID=1738132 RepID=A0AAD7CII0_9AGAR|nr:hypothetical protein FB45DRAFT_885919 [Roridomyces roridus]